MKSGEILTKEHLPIKQMLKVLGKMAEKLQAEGVISTNDLEKAVDFFRNFADKLHHGKEEALLFPLILKIGNEKEKGLVNALLVQHQRGRQYVKNMAGGIEEKNNSKILENAKGYIGLLTKHIDLEDNIFFPACDKTLSDKQQENLKKEFEIVEKEEIGLRKINELLSNLNKLTEIYIKERV